MAELALLTPGGASDALPLVLSVVELLPHRVHVLGLDPSALLSRSISTTGAATSSPQAGDTTPIRVAVRTTSMTW